ncbi:hypothetical protein CTEN210_18291 [Chaetoceros tenuissimus]|uniref:DOT1 domain-containing protein n=1 Tax=Chaetoceros tenuissimus TaxID=426638 RepID=A0AAD3DEB8_9STRA|nr:hypothetical protein CTEN210_18291 [Chaetoceros tenuissimus]
MNESTAKSNSHHERNSSKKKIALGLTAASFVATVGLISPFITMQLRSSLPYMATPRRKILAALKEISKRKESQSSAPNQQFKYYDLGSGDGETVLAAASTGWKATGIELNSTLWGISSLRRLFSPLSIRSRSAFIYGDIWKNSIRDADAVMIFGVKPLMPAIAEKIGNECDPGTFVMAYRFHVPICSSEQVNEKGEIRDGSLEADLIYDEEEMRIYQLRDKVDKR